MKTGSISDPTARAVSWLFMMLSPFWEGDVLGRYAGGSPVAEYSSRIRFRSGGNSPSVRWLSSAGTSITSGSTRERRPSALALRSRG